MNDDPQKSIYRGAWKVGLQLLKGLLVPFAAGVLMYCLSYPLGYVACSSYADAIEHPFKYQWFSCYIQTKDGDWLLKQEYQSSKVGMKVILSADLK